MGIVYEIFKKGWLGSYKQACAYCCGNYLTEMGPRKISKEWDDEIHQIRENYQGVRLWVNGSGDRIGEYVTRYFMLMRNIEENNDGYLNVMLDGNYDLGNKALSKIISRNVPVCNTENKEKWIYILSKLSKFMKVDYDKYLALKIRVDDKRIYDFEWAKNKLLLSEKEIQYCEQKMKEMGLKEPYVCIFNRDHAFFNSLHPRVDCHYHDYRNSSIKTRYPTIDYLAEKGIRSVRVGSIANERCAHGDCIDYAFDYRDELMDVFLHTRAKFCIGDNTGLNILPISTNGNYVCTNFDPLFFQTANCFPHNFNGLLIFKKLFDTKKNKFLTLEEMVVAEERGGFYTEKYTKMGLKHIDNSAQEILDATMEMNERINGTWVETEEDKLRQEKIHAFFEKIEKKYGLAKADNILDVRIGARFLEQNWEIFGLDD